MQQAQGQQPPPGLQQAQGQQPLPCKAPKRSGGGSGSSSGHAVKEKKHHLLRHSVTDEARRAAVDRFCGGDAGQAEQGAAAIWKLQ